MLITGITGSSTLVQPGDLFAAVPGAKAHGAQYVPAALAAGAIAVLTDEAGAAGLDADVPRIVVPDVRAALGPISAQVYGHPSRRMHVLGVTGTSGKTTTTFLMRAGLRAVGREVGLIGTVATMIGDETVEAGFTTPEAPELQALLAIMAERGLDSVVMEVSSHAVVMRRIDGVEFAVGGFTNLSEDHLDFHTDMEDYFAAKLDFVRRASLTASMVDDEWGQRVAAATDAVTVSTTDAPATFRAGDVTEAADGTTTFTATGPSGERRLGCAIPGRYNVANVMLALVLLDLAGVGGAEVSAAISAAQVPGRMERIASEPFLAVVDYSHKPAAVEGALRALRPLTAGRLIVVLGAGGDRDRGKRPHMGEAAARDADVLIVTDDNPRSEDPATIRRAVLAGAAAVPTGVRAEILEIGDRGAAIAEAVRLAALGDTVLVAGKGHETGQEVAGVKHPFDDRVVLREALGR